jgi:hypothetical protein
MNVARSADEAERQAKGENLSGRSAFDRAEEELPELADVFEEGAAPVAEEEPAETGTPS